MLGGLPGCGQPAALSATPAPAMTISAPAPTDTVIASTSAPAPTDTVAPAPTAAPAPTERPALGAAPAADALIVATNGSDDNPGTLSQPWRTVQHAATVAPPGSTVLVRGGSYAEMVSINVSGTSAAPTTFQNYPGETPVLDGTTLAISDASSALLQIADQSYLVIRGFELRGLYSADANQTPVGISINGAAHHLTLQGNRIYGLGTTVAAAGQGNALGIAVYGTDAQRAITDLVIDGNELFDLKLGFSETMSINGNVDGFQVSNNHLHDVNNIGIDVIGYEGTAPDPAVDVARHGLLSGNLIERASSTTNPAYSFQPSAGGIYVDGGRDITIERNVVTGSDIGIELASEHAGRNTEAIIVRSNQIYANRGPALSLGGYDAARGGTANCVIVNNTFYGNDTSASGAAAWILQFAAVGNRFDNNIVVAGAMGQLLSNSQPPSSNNSLDHNLFWAAPSVTPVWTWQGVESTTLALYQQRSGNDLHSLYADPALRDPAHGDLHLTAASPARNAGAAQPSAGDADMDGAGRTAELQIDIGADEFAPPAAGQPLAYLPLLMVR